MKIRIRKDYGVNGQNNMDESLGGTTLGKAFYELAKIVQNLAAGTTVAAPATGWLQFATKVNHVDGEVITIPNGASTAVKFYIDQTGSYTPGGGYNATNVRLNISGATTANDVAVIAATAINAAALEVSSTAANGAGLIYLISTVPGAAGNGAILETVEHASFAKAGLTGGRDATADAFSTVFDIDA